jgi:hypothetical protein
MSKEWDKERHNRSLYLANNKNLDDDDISYEKEFITLNVCFQMMVVLCYWSDKEEWVSEWVRDTLKWKIKFLIYHKKILQFVM